MFEYEYKLVDGNPVELDAAVAAYQYAGWELKCVTPKQGLPTHIVFTWNKDCAPVYPIVNYP